MNLSRRQHAYLGQHDIPSREGHSLSSDLSIADLVDCVVDMRLSVSSNVKLTAIHIRDIQGCVILLPDIGGSILAHNMENCLLIVSKCQQV